MGVHPKRLAVRGLEQRMDSAHPRLPVPGAIRIWVGVPAVWSACDILVGLHCCRLRTLAHGADPSATPRRQSLPSSFEAYKAFCARHFCRTQHHNEATLTFGILTLEFRPFNASLTPQGWGRAPDSNQSKSDPPKKPNRAPRPFSTRRQAEGDAPCRTAGSMRAVHLRAYYGPLRRRFHLHQLGLPGLFRLFPREAKDTEASTAVSLDLTPF